jgi:hypothetical protein
LPRIAPANTDPIAALRPSWASEMTSCTPCRPRALRERRNAVQNAPSSLSPTSKPEDFAVAVRAHGGGHDHGLGDHAPVHPGLAVGRVEEDVRVGVGLQAPAAEGCDFLIEVGTDPGDLRLLEIPVSTPRALTRSSTFRVDTPCR